MKTLIIILFCGLLVGCSLVYPEPKKILMSWESKYHTYDQSIIIASHAIKCFLGDKENKEILSAMRLQLKNDSGLKSDLELTLLLAIADEGGFGFDKNFIKKYDPENKIAERAGYCFEDNILELPYSTRTKYGILVGSSLPGDGYNNGFFKYKWCSDVTTDTEVKECNK